MELNIFNVEIYLPYTLEITSFYNLNTANDIKREKLTEGDWYVATVFIEFLDRKSVV